MRTMMSIAGLVIALYVVLVFATYFFQRKLQYFPSPNYVTPAQAGLKNVQEVILATPDGEKLKAWYAPALAQMPTIVYFHGNGAGLIDRAQRMEKYQVLGFGFFIAAYRSYAGSSGSPSEPALIADAHLAYDYVRNHGVKPKHIVVFGESLGTAVATQLAASVKVGAVVLESPFTSAVEVGALQYPYLPVRYLMKDQYHTDELIGQVKEPVLVVHGGQDTIVPLSMGKRIFELASEPKEFLTLSLAGHNNHDQFGLVAKVHAFISKHIAVK